MASTFKRTRKRKDGSSYGVWVCEDEYEGQKKTITGKSEKEVKAKMKEWIKEMALYGNELKKTKETFGSYALYYYATYKKGAIALNSYRIYMEMLKIHILPALGNKKLADITKSDIQALYNSKAHMSYSTLKSMEIVLNTVFDGAEQDRLIRFNPMSKSLTIKSKKPAKGNKAMSLEQQEAYVKALDGEQYRLIYLTLLYAGLRVGECLALTWEDYNDGVLNINKKIGSTYTYDDKGNATFKVVLSEGTKNGVIRDVPLPSFIKAEYEAIKKPTGVIFQSSTGNHVSPVVLYQMQKRICERAGIPFFTLHKLRHTYATRLLELGKSPKVAQVLLGHTNISTTMNTYSHVFKDIKIDTVNDLPEF